MRLKFCWIQSNKAIHLTRAFEKKLYCGWINFSEVWNEQRNNYFPNLFAGVGIATMIVVFFLDIYYCIIIAWTIFYLISSFVAIPDLPWDTCGNKSNLHIPKILDFLNGGKLESWKEKLFVLFCFWVAISWLLFTFKLMQSDVLC